MILIISSTYLVRMLSRYTYTESGLCGGCAKYDSCTYIAVTVNAMYFFNIIRRLGLCSWGELGTLRAISTVASDHSILMSLCVGWSTV